MLAAKLVCGLCVACGEACVWLAARGAAEGFRAKG